jgi:hypothetical protein
VRERKVSVGGEAAAFSVFGMSSAILTHHCTECFALSDVVACSAGCNNKVPKLDTHAAPSTLSPSLGTSQPSPRLPFLPLAA